MNRWFACWIGLSLSFACSGREETGEEGPRLGGGGCSLPECPVQSGIDEDADEASFRSDVLASLRRHCSEAVCHGVEANAGGGLFLGPPPPAELDVEALLARLVSVPSRTAPELSLIEPEDPDGSFLVMKVEGCQNTFELECEPQLGVTSGQPCGDVMPQAGRLLCDEERELLRTWIAQGARDN